MMKYFLLSMVMVFIPLIGMENEVALKEEGLLITNNTQVSAKCRNKLQDIEDDAQILRFYLKKTFLLISQWNFLGEGKPSDILNFTINDNCFLDQMHQLKYMQVADYLKLMCKNSKHLDDKFNKYKTEFSCEQAWDKFGDYFETKRINTTIAELKNALLQKEK